MAKYNVTRFVLSSARGFIGGTFWSRDGGQGGIRSAEFDDQARILTVQTAAEKIRIPAEGIAEMVYGVTAAKSSD